MFHIFYQSFWNVQYTCLQLRVDPIGPAFDLTLPIEIIIGTVPHRILRQEQQYANVSSDRSSNRQCNGGISDRMGSPVNHHYESPSVNPVEPIYSYACAADRDPNRPPSRSSSAPSTVSTSSTAYSKRSTSKSYTIKPISRSLSWIGGIIYKASYGNLRIRSLFFGYVATFFVIIWLICHSMLQLKARWNDWR